MQAEPFCRRPRRPHGPVRPKRFNVTPPSGVPRSNGKTPPSGNDCCHGLGIREGGEYRQMKVWIYVDTSKQIGDRDYLKVFASPGAALAWIEVLQFTNCSLAPQMLTLGDE
jgi:hypothetical protein